MYYGNKNDDELAYFHKKIKAGFSISLTDLLTNTLFNVEDMGNSIYRVYPLFYSDRITSSNVNDVILDTRCIILHQESYETYLTFSVDEETDTHALDDDIINTIGTGDSVNTKDFNSMMYRLRRTETLRSSQSFRNGNEVNDQYATFKFSNISGPHNDDGLIINDGIKRLKPNVSFENSVFNNVKYILEFKVVSITGMNVCSGDDEDYITEDTFTVELTQSGIYYPIDLSDYTNDSILLYDFDVIVSFDVPEIDSGFTLDLGADKEWVLKGTELELTAQLDSSGSVDDYTVEFFEDGVLIGTEATDNDGYASLTYTPTVEGMHVYSARCLGQTASVNAEMAKYTPNLTLTSNKSTAYYPSDTFTVSGTLTNPDGAMSGATVKVYTGDILLATLTTGSSGDFSHTVSVSGSIKRIYDLHGTYDGNSTNYEAESSNVVVTARKRLTNITAHATKTANGTIILSGILRDEWGSILVNKRVRVNYPSSNGTISGKYSDTDSNGVYHLNFTSSEYKSWKSSETLTPHFNGDDYYDKCQINITIQKAKL